MARCSAQIRDTKLFSHPLTAELGRQYVREEAYAYQLLSLLCNISTAVSVRTHWC